MSALIEDTLIALASLFSLLRAVVTDVVATAELLREDDGVADQDGLKAEALLRVMMTLRSVRDELMYTMKEMIDVINKIGDVVSVGYTCWQALTRIVEVMQEFAQWHEEPSHQE